MSPKLIGLTGRKFAGKTTVAKTLTPEFVQVSFAEPIRQMLYAIGVTEVEMADKETVIPRFGKSPRYMMQTLGTEWGRDLINPDIWINLAKAKIEELNTKFPLLNVVVDDIRFDDEAEMIRSLGGAIWEVICTSSVPLGDAHRSESGISPRLISVGLRHDFEPALVPRLRSILQLPARVESQLPY